MYVALKEPPLAGTISSVLGWATPEARVITPAPAPVPSQVMLVYQVKVTVRPRTAIFGDN